MSRGAEAQTAMERQIAELQTALKVLMDKDAIRDAVYRYCSGADRSDLELMRSAYHPDATDEHGDVFQGLGWDLAADSFRRNTGSHSTTLHSIGNVNIELRGDTAFVESYVTTHHYEPQSDGKQAGYIWAGRYVDRFERRAGEWRIAHRVAVHDWSRDEPPFSENRVGLTYAQGVRSVDDPRYRR